ncbi:proteophosphoglycan ppg4 [Strigomonas culicis]|uniref:Proteophosphoglycan ppg4 n=1 Tax=Strigomonas culicis TaxID=28005 RepID=S9UN56_9TRYP|nr:proteophosphoglycan ppg4 [Strigomonas culicis]|eukprot:EPY16091.1 proteophosphoglycan ppg4 [Strigomonas culicis]
MNIDDLFSDHPPPPPASVAAALTSSGPTAPPVATGAAHALDDFFGAGSMSVPGEAATTSTTGPAALMPFFHPNSIAGSGRTASAGKASSAGHAETGSTIDYQDFRSSFSAASTKLTSEGSSTVTEEQQQQQQAPPSAAAGARPPQRVVQVPPRLPHLHLTSPLAVATAPASTSGTPEGSAPSTGAATTASGSPNRQRGEKPFALVQFTEEDSELTDTLQLSARRQLALAPTYSSGSSMRLPHSASALPFNNGSASPRRSAARRSQRCRPSRGQVRPAC